MITIGFFKLRCVYSLPEQVLLMGVYFIKVASEDS